jgi:pimeloyl-ACP methyl ester carboxylesterase
MPFGPSVQPLAPTGAGRAVARCSFSSEGLCGKVTVPLDRSQPSGQKIAIRYVLFRHTQASRPSLGTIFVTEGGPGFSAIQSSQDAYRHFLFEPLLNRRDLVLIDQRGVGRSAAIGCQPLQRENTPIYPAVRTCGRQLGTSSDLYGSADVALDVEAVRADLGVQRFDYYGGSYAGMDIQAYAARFPGRLRSVVLDSPVVLSAEDPWFTIGVAQEVRVVARVCRRSASCSAVNHDPAGDVRWLARRLRRHPFRGVGRDADGVLHRVRVTESRLVHMLGNDAGGFVTSSEIPAAAYALRHGDRAPLLRLAAENDFPLFHGDPGDAKQFSLGDNVARFCTDAKFQWDKHASLTRRRAQFDRARRALNPNRFAPFSVDGWVFPASLGGAAPDPCIGWPAPTHQPAPTVPSGTVVPGVPALVLIGDLDLNVPPRESATLTRMFPRSTVVNLTESGHHTVFSFQSACAGAMVRHFIRTLGAGQTGCASRIPYHVSAVGRFPGRVPRDEHRKVRTRSAARIAAATVEDAFERMFLSSNQRGVGLHAGTFDGRFTNSGAILNLHRVRLARDLSVTGTAHHRQYSVLDATLAIRGATRGSLRVRGILFNRGATRLTITGRLGRHKIRTSVPAT